MKISILAWLQKEKLQLNVDQLQKQLQKEKQLKKLQLEKQLQREKQQQNENHVRKEKLDKKTTHQSDKSNSLREKYQKKILVKTIS